MKRIILSLACISALSGCDAIDALRATSEMNKKMNETNAQTGKVVNGVHQQALVIPIGEITKPESFERLMPFPTVIALYAKPFAEEATAREMIELTYLWLKDIEEISPEPDYDREPKYDKDGNPLPVVDVDVKRVNERRREKIGKLTALEAIAGFAPQATVEQIIRDQILSYGRFYETAMKFLMLRFVFIRDILLENSLLAQNLDVVGEVEETIDYMDKLDFIGRLPFYEQIGLRTSGIPAPYHNADYKLDAGTAQYLYKSWKRVKMKAESEILLEKRSLTGDGRMDQALLDNATLRFKQAQAKLESRVQRWKARAAVVRP